MSKHTKGPWTAERVGNNIEISAQTDHGHLSVAWVHMGDERDPTQDEVCRIDAHLIAAAPEMYEVLFGIANADWRKWDDGLNRPEEFVAWAKSIAGHVVAKAEGNGHKVGHSDPTAWQASAMNGRI